MTEDRPVQPRVVPPAPDVRSGPGRVPRPRLARGRGDVLAVIALGGALGSTARYGVTVLLPHAPDRIPWSTVAANLSGAFVLGVLMVFVNEVWSPNRYVRPLLGVGVLGGYTTFSTYMLDAQALARVGELAALAAYVLVTLVGGLLAVWLGAALGRLLTRGRGAGHDVTADPPTANRLENPA